MASVTLADALTAAVTATTITVAQAAAIKNSYEANAAPLTAADTYIVPGTISYSGGVLRFRRARRVEDDAAWIVGEPNGWSFEQTETTPL